MNHAGEFLSEVRSILERIDCETIERIVAGLARLRDNGGRLFLLGVGGSAAMCSHAVNDFRKLCGIEAYTPVDNVSELTARTNDEGFDSVFSAYLEGSNASERDAVFVLSVGGGDPAKNVSVNIVRALELAKRRNMAVYGLVGRDGGFTKVVGDAVCVIPTVNPARVTPHTEGLHAVLCHCLVSHPGLQRRSAKWEHVAQQCGGER